MRCGRDESAGGDARPVKPPLFTLVDIGVRGGIDPRWRRFADVLHVLAIDADENAEPFETAGIPRYEFVCAAVGPRAGAVDLYVTRQEGCSSTLRPNHALLAQFPDASRFDVVRTAKVMARPLDQLLREHGVDRVDFVKLDTQGSELSILKESTSALASAVGVEVEVEFLPLYEGQPLFGEVDGFLRAQGFDLFDLNRGYWQRSARPAVGRGQLVFADALYFRSAESLVKASSRAGQSLANAVLAAAAYGYLDYGRTLLEWGRQRQVFGTGEAELAMAWLERACRGSRLMRLMRGVRGVGRVSRALARVAEALRPDHWACVDGRLGNTGK